MPSKKAAKAPEVGSTNGQQEQEEQQALIPMSAEELRAAAFKLAGLNLELEEMSREHAAQRTEDKEARESLRKRISSISGQIKQQGR